MQENAILPPTASGDGAGARFVSTDGVRRWRWGALLCALLPPSPPRFRGIALKTLTDRGVNTREEAKSGATRLDLMKRGRGINDRDDKSSGIDIRMTDALAT